MKTLFSHQKEDEGEKTASNNLLPSVSKDEHIAAVLNSKEGKTSPLKPFTEGGLINQSCGNGWKNGR
ncbi:hypothetical protein [Metabacillus idriensis]|uniref:hypothetical protein n=1 Tax=Metabacillus idriensis TaxID=324768 RepID=UPI00174CCCDC|nr:hypothetical protein [Metabacillus idriensis]